jgi:hypothetical protein
MDVRLRESVMDGSGSGLRPTVGFGVSSVEPSCPPTIVLILNNTNAVGQPNIFHSCCVSVLNASLFKLWARLLDKI